MIDSSIKILNNSNYYDITQPKYKRVQRPFTEESARQRKNDWFFRCVKDFEFVISKGGSVWIPTLTYNNENLPHLHLNDFVQTLPIESKEPNSDLYMNIPDSFYIPCFCQDHIQSFTKKLRIYLSRLGYNTIGMNWVICSEFGEKKKRPHYHAYISILDDIPYDVMIDTLRRAWIYGFVGCSKEFGMKCKSIYGVRYATKYVVKDLSYYNTLKFPNKMTINDIIIHQDSFESKDLRKLLRPYMPNMYSSKGVGRGFLSELVSMSENDLLEYCLGKKTFPFALGKNKSMQFRLPQYYVSKFSYVVDKDLTNYYDKTIMRLTDFGRKLMYERNSKTIQKYVDILDKITLKDAQYVNCVTEFHQFKSFSSVDLAVYMGLFRYMIPYDETFNYNPNINVSDVCYRSDWYFENLLGSNRANIYCADFLLRHGLVDKDWYAENCSFPLRARVTSHDSLDLCMASPLLGFKTCSELPQFKAYEACAKAFDAYMSALFNIKECKKYNKRMQLEEDKHKCFMSNPDNFKVYESIKNLEMD